MSSAVIEGHLLQRSAFQDLHNAAVLAGQRYERVGEPIPRIVDVDWIVAELPYAQQKSVECAQWTRDKWLSPPRPWSR